MRTRIFGACGTVDIETPGTRVLVPVAVRLAGQDRGSRANASERLRGIVACLVSLGGTSQMQRDPAANRHEGT